MNKPLLNLKGSQKVLLAGVPFGQDNVGDEAILECVVSLVREVCPSARITVSTGDQAETARNLDVDTCPLFGFNPSGPTRSEIENVIRDHDVFIWAGATGLSDYPDVSLSLLEMAQQLRKRTAILCTGMNSQLNPFLYKLLPGRRLRLFNLIHSMTFGALDLTHMVEERKERRTRERMAALIAKTDLVIVRDEQSRDELQATTRHNNIVVGADPAIVLRTADTKLAPLCPGARQALETANPRIGICISSQSPVRDLQGLAQMLDGVLQNNPRAALFCIPMNPITDTKLMEEFTSTMRKNRRVHVIDNCPNPSIVAGLAAQMDVVISSRLHLLILASNSLTPIVGISRGSKVTNYTSQFNLPDNGSVENLNIAGLRAEIMNHLQNPDRFRKQAEAVRGRMLARLETVKQLLADLLGTRDEAKPVGESSYQSTRQTEALVLR